MTILPEHRLLAYASKDVWVESRVAADSLCWRLPAGLRVGEKHVHFTPTGWERSAASNLGNHIVRWRGTLSEVHPDRESFPAIDRLGTMDAQSFTSNAQGSRAGPVHSRR